MSSPETEGFHISEANIEASLDPYARHSRQTKSQATYGIWAGASSESEDEDERPSFGGIGGGRRNKRNKKDYTAPVGFISGGFKKSTEEELNKKRDDDNADNDESDEDDEKWGGFGRPSAHFNRSKRAKGPSGLKQSRQHPSSQEVGDWEKYTRGIGAKLLAKMGHIEGKGLGKDLQGIQTPVEAIMRKDSKASLGFHGSERTERSLKDFPVEKSDEEGEDDELVPSYSRQWRKDSSKSRKSRFKPKYVFRTAEQLLSSSASSKTGSRVRITQDSPLANVKVIDMTSKEQRVLSGYAAISQKHDKPSDSVDATASTTSKNFEMPELLHNLDLLINMTEEKIITNSRKLQFERDNVVNLEHEKKRMEKVLQREKQAISQLERIIHIIDELETCSKSTSEDGSNDPIEATLSMEECARLLTRLREEFGDDFYSLSSGSDLYCLTAVAEAAVFPLVEKALIRWNPLVEPTFCMAQMKMWRALLADSSISDNERSYDRMDAWDRLLWTKWMPKIRIAVSLWRVRECEPLVVLLEHWLPLLPRWIVDNIICQLVLPRLSDEVDSWDPLKDPVPIHSWIHPWLPLIRDASVLEPGVFQPMRSKLSAALTRWLPSDRSAKMMLQPWRGVWNQGHMDAFILRNIFPKLVQILDRFVVNPADQNLDGWNWVMAWSEFIPINVMVDLLDKHFFLKWLQALCQWLDNNANLEEVGLWYQGWKSQFSSELIDHPIVKSHLARALDIMKRSMSNMNDGEEQKSHSNMTDRQFEQGPAMTYLMKLMEERLNRERSKQRERELPSAGISKSELYIPTSFRELIEKKAAENGLLFMPVVGKTREAHQIYTFGDVQIIIDNGVIFMKPDGSKVSRSHHPSTIGDDNDANETWVPVSLNDLAKYATF